MSVPDTDHERPSRLKTALADLVWCITPSCKEVVRLTSEQQDRALSGLMKFRLRLHRRFCVWCTRYAKHLGVVHEAMDQLEDHLKQVEPGLSADRKARLKQLLAAPGRRDS